MVYTLENSQLKLQKKERKKEKHEHTYLSICVLYENRIYGKERGNQISIDLPEDVG